ncbi:MAG: copper resistance protein NlpE N-terminal domain-containing protein [Crocinitomicaceae bacterium]
MKFSFYLSIATVLAFQGCATNNDNTSDVYGTYSGQIPCADCPGINYELTLNKDNTYHKTMVYQERSTNPVEESGNFDVSKKSVVTIENKDKKTEKYQLNDDKLVMLDTQGKKMSGELADKYVLTKGNPTSNTGMPILTSIFRGTGTEPFWNIEMKKNGELYFSCLKEENQNFKFDTSRTKPLKDGFGIIYQANSADATIMAILTKGTCSDGMSETEYTYKVEVHFKKTADKAETIYNGCGFYMADYRLHDIWALESIDGKPIDKAALKMGVPTMEIDLVKNHVSGFAGCNQYGGDIKLGQSVITFSSVYSTKMACDNLDVENQFLQAISEKTMSFILEKGFLTLKSGNSSVVLKKVD